jgi:hypothetical protein
MGIALKVISILSLLSIQYGKYFTERFRMIKGVTYHIAKTIQIRKRVWLRSLSFDRRT